MIRNNYKQQAMIRITCLLSLIITGFLARSQSFTITGPQCVRIGVEYQYIISSDSIDRVQVCLLGGVFAYTKLNCIEDTVLTEVRVTWTDSSSGQLTLRSGGRSYSKVVSIAKELDAGSISKEMAVRSVKEGSIAEDIIYTTAKGGGCNPKYIYQWQQSEDNMHWTDVSGTDKQKFTFSSALTRSLYFRRKVTDVNSGNTSYTEPVAVFFKPEKSTN
jgi:hypothetical protein